MAGHSIPLGAAPHGDALGLLASEPASLSGRVVETADGRIGRHTPGTPISGVAMRLLDDQGALLEEAFTDANGRFQFSNLLPGVYALQEIQPAGFASGVSLPGNGGGQRLADNLLGEIVVEPGASWTNYVFYNYASPPPAGAAPGVEPTGSNAAPRSAAPPSAAAGSATIEGFWITWPTPAEPQRPDSRPASVPPWHAPTPRPWALRMDPNRETNAFRQVDNNVVHRPASEPPVDLIDFWQFETPRLEVEASISAWLAEREVGCATDRERVDDARSETHRQGPAPRASDHASADDRWETAALARAEGQPEISVPARLAWGEAQQEPARTRDEGADPGAQSALRTATPLTVEHGSPSQSPDEIRATPRRMSAIVPRRAAARLQ